MSRADERVRSRRCSRKRRRIAAFDLSLRLKPSFSSRAVGGPGGVPPGKLLDKLGLLGAGRGSGGGAAGAPPPGSSLNEANIASG